VHTYICMSPGRWGRWFKYPMRNRVAIFRQKNYSTEERTDGTEGLFRQNSGCVTAVSEPVRGREKHSEYHFVEQKYKQTFVISYRTIPLKRKRLGIPSRGTDRTIFRNFVPNHPAEKKNARYSNLLNVNRNKLLL
jgi:hypothetical protein